MDDVVQEAFCRLATAEPPPDNPTAWLYAVSRNLSEKQRLSDRRRRERETARAAPEACSVDPGNQLESAEALAAVDQLDVELREVLLARIWGQLSLEDVAQLCEISTATAFRRYQAALHELRLKLEGHKED